MRKTWAVPLKTRGKEKGSLVRICITEPTDKEVGAERTDHLLGTYYQREVKPHKVKQHWVPRGSVI